MWKYLLVTLMLSTNLVYANPDICVVEAHFTPKESGTEIIVPYVRQAKKSIHMSLYGLTNPRLYDELVLAHNRGVDVVLLVDRLQSSIPSSLTDELQALGIPVIVKRTSALEHNKFAIIDNKLVVTGSWNWSISADKQDNNIIVIYGCNETIQEFKDTFEYIRKRDSLI